ncbi:hypothetical protein MN116_006984 [Schistosoma mekongi]|uniref:Serine/threonine-protein kinase TOR n=1 Tax=Schistosoma mekongi TaxID=38744 RepID=A0AAE1Z899_SCHME|nr:hypothetical protein MN116_006984 [Schistosoma mekongi]
MGEASGSFSNLETGASSVTSRTFFSSGGNSRHKTNPNPISTVSFPSFKCPMNEISSTSSPFIWYRDCLIESIRAQSETASVTQQDPASHSSNLRKLNRDDWMHGNILILQELIFCVQPQFCKLVMELDQMCGLPLFEFLTVSHSDGSLAVRTVLSTRWPVVNASCISVAIGVLPGNQFCSSDPEHLPNLALEVLGLRDGITQEPNSCQQHHEQQQQKYGRQNFSNLSSEICRCLLLENIDKIWASVLTWINTRNHQIMFLLYKLIPRLVALKPSEFQDTERQITVMDWMFQCLRKEKEKPMILLNLSLMCYFMGTEFAKSSYLTQLFQAIRSYLPAHKDIPNKKRSPALETSAILSVSLFTKSLGPAVHESVNQILDAMVASGLNQPLIASFKVIATHIPRLRKEIQDCLLNNISLVLMNNSKGSFNHLHSYVTNTAGGVNTISTLSFFPNLINLVGGTVHGGSPGTNLSALSSNNTGNSASSAGCYSVNSNTNTFPLSAATRFVFGLSTKSHSTKPTSTTGLNATGSEFANVAIPGGVSASGELSTDVAVLALALKTLGSFNFDGHTLAHFVRHICDNFISVSTCEVKEIRLEAVKTCAHLMIPWLKCTETQQWYARPALNTVADVLNKLLTVGISDPDPDVRRCVFLSFDRRFDLHLAQSDHLNYLFLALYDEVFDIRCLVMQRLGRLSDINPACVQPNLRKVLLHTLDDLSHSGSTRNKEQAALLLACLIATAPRFFVPYSEPLIHILLPRIRQALPASLRATLAVTSFSRLQNSAFDNNKETDSSSSLFPTERAPASTQLIQNVILATQIAANAAAASANAVVAAAAASSGVGVGGLHFPFTNISRRTSLIRRGPVSCMGTNQIGPALASANAVAKATAAATAAAAAASAVMIATGHTSIAADTSGGVFNTDEKNIFCTGLVPNFGCKSDVSMHDLTTIVERFANLNFDFNRDTCFHSEFPPGRYPQSTYFESSTSLINSFMFGDQCSFRNQSWSEYSISRIGENSSSAQWAEPTPVIVALFTTLGRLAAVSPRSIYNYIDEFIPILAYMMQDTSCFLKRSIAVWTLTRLVSHTGYVVTPYKRYPQLLNILLSMLKREEIKCIRQEVLRALGVLGALDPFKFKLYSGQVDTYGDTGIAVSHHEVVERKDVDITQSELVINLSWESRDVFFSVCALSALIHSLRDPALHSQYGSIVHTIVYVLKLLGPRSVIYLRQLIPDYFRCLENTRDTRLQEFLIRQLGNVMTIVQLNTKEFAHEVVDLLITHWWIAPNVQRACIGLLSPMSSVLGAEFRAYLTRLIPTILRMFHHESNEANLIALLEVLPEFGYTLKDYAHIIVPAISNLIDITSEANLAVLLNSVTDNTPSSNINFSTSVSHSPTTRCTSPIDSDTTNLSDILGGVSDNSCTATNDTNLGGIQSSNTNTVSSNGLNQQILVNKVGSVHLRKACLECLARFTDCVDVDDFAGQIIHPICRLLLTLESCHQSYQQLLHQHHHLSSSSTKSSASLG